MSMLTSFFFNSSSERSVALIITDLVCVECFVIIKLLSSSALSLYVIVTISSMQPANNCNQCTVSVWTLVTSAMMLDGNNALDGKTNTNYLLVDPLQQCRPADEVLQEEITILDSTMWRGEIFIIQPHPSLSLAPCWMHSIVLYPVSPPHTLPCHGSLVSQ